MSDMKFASSLFKGAFFSDVRQLGASERQRWAGHNGHLIEKNV